MTRQTALLMPTTRVIFAAEGMGPRSSRGRQSKPVIPAHTGIHRNRRHGPPIKSGRQSKPVKHAHAGIHRSRRHGPPTESEATKQTCHTRARGYPCPPKARHIKPNKTNKPQPVAQSPAPLSGASGVHGWCRLPPGPAVHAAARYWAWWRGVDAASGAAPALGGRG